MPLVVERELLGDEQARVLGESHADVGVDDVGAVCVRGGGAGQRGDREGGDD